MLYGACSIHTHWEAEALAPAGSDGWHASERLDQHAMLKNRRPNARLIDYCNSVKFPLSMFDQLQACVKQNGVQRVLRYG